MMHAIRSMSPLSSTALAAGKSKQGGLDDVNLDSFDDEMKGMKREHEGEEQHEHGHASPRTPPRPTRMRLDVPEFTFTAVLNEANRATDAHDALMAGQEKPIPSSYPLSPRRSALEGPCAKAARISANMIEPNPASRAHVAYDAHGFGHEESGSPSLSSSPRRPPQKAFERAESRRLNREKENLEGPYLSPARENRTGFHFAHDDPRRPAFDEPSKRVMPRTGLHTNLFGAPRTGLNSNPFGADEHFAPDCMQKVLLPPPVTGFDEAPPPSPASSSARSSDAHDSELDSELDSDEDNSPGKPPGYDMEQCTPSGYDVKQETPPPTPPTTRRGASMPWSSAGSLPIDNSISNPNGPSLHVLYDACAVAALSKIGVRAILGAGERKLMGDKYRPSPLLKIEAEGEREGDKINFKHDYKRGKDCDVIGREFSLVQQYRREVRGLLFGGTYTEFDLPTIMLTWAARKYGLPLQTLRSYVSNRATFIDILADTTHAVELKIKSMGLVTGMRIFDALYVESLTVPEDTLPVLSAMADAANDCIEALFPKVSILHCPSTPLAFSCEPLVASISLEVFLMREREMTLQAVEDAPAPVEKNNNFGFWEGFCDRWKSQLVSDRHNKVYWRDAVDVIWFESSIHRPPAVMVAAIHAYAQELEALDPDQKIKWGKKLCGSYGWRAYHAAVLMYARPIEGMWHANNPTLPEDTTRDFNADDYYTCKFALDYDLWKSVPEEEREAELRAHDEGFFEDEAQRVRVTQRVALSVLMCKGNFCKKALVLKGPGNNGKSAFVNRLQLICKMVDAHGVTSTYRFISEGNTDQLWMNTSEINAALAGVYESKCVLLEEGTKVKAETFKKFTGGSHTASGARRPFELTTQSDRNHCSPIFCMNNDIEWSGVADEATLMRMEEMTFKVTNYPSAAALETKLVTLVADAEESAQASREHSASEVRRWKAAERRGMHFSVLDQAAAAHHEGQLNVPFSEAAARAHLGVYHRLGNQHYADEIEHNNVALTSAFMYMAKLNRKYKDEGGEKSLVPLEANSVAEALAYAPPDTCADKIASFIKTKVVYSSKTAVKATDMMEAVMSFLVDLGELHAISKTQLTTLALTFKTEFDTAFRWKPERDVRGSKVHPTFEKCTLADIALKNRNCYCRVMLKPVEPVEPVSELARVEPEPEPDFDLSSQFEQAATDFEYPGGTFDLIKDVEPMQGAARVTGVSTPATTCTTSPATSSAAKPAKRIVVE
ncbi:hypothetical protein T492DRAFT_873818 [Pavlovales sp. CCMP2436]|nr:hypothetical protein T492DRAFT_873818 [Pavlovales sp. CCMP2436]